MGCGASKAAQVAKTEITTEPNPERSDGAQVPNEAESELSTRSGKKLLHLSSSTTTASVSMGKASTALVRSPPARGSDPHSNLQITSGENSAMESTALERSDQAVAERTSGSAGGRYAAFEVDMGHRGTIDPIAPPPKRLENQEVAPRATADALAEKQREVQERKEKELSRRASRVSRKERLRREIMESRELESQESKSDQIDKQLGNPEFEDDHSKDLVEGPVEMEVDHTYNADTALLDDWLKDEHTLSTSREVVGGGTTSVEAPNKSDDTFTNWEPNNLQEFQ